jgi:hypothetical protein
MKQFARQSRPLALVPSPIEEVQPRADNNNESSSSLRDFFDDWLSGMSPAMLQSPTEEVRPARTFYGRTPLTSTDMTRVNRATVRESGAHRHWPREVVETFLAAEVIRRKR